MRRGKAGRRLRTGALARRAEGRRAESHGSMARVWFGAALIAAAVWAAAQAQTTTALDPPPRRFTPALRHHPDNITSLQP